VDDPVVEVGPTAALTDDDGAVGEDDPEAPRDVAVVGHLHPHRQRAAGYAAATPPADLAGVGGGDAGRSDHVAPRPGRGVQARHAQPDVDGIVAHLLVAAVGVVTHIGPGADLGGHVLVEAEQALVYVECVVV
jgi:hypothetical protein